MGNRSFNKIMLTYNLLFQNNSHIRHYLLFLKLCRHIRRKPNACTIHIINVHTITLFSSCMLHLEYWSVMSQSTRWSSMHFNSHWVPCLCIIGKIKIANKYIICTERLIFMYGITLLQYQSVLKFKHCLLHAACNASISIS